jgi:uncharacterized protein YqjF (DUF2071 family)
MANIEVPFMSAHFKYLAMLNYEVDPGILAHRVPHGTELDSFAGKTLVSMVAFLSLKTRVLGIAIPWHRNFEQINLPFYVRRSAVAGLYGPEFVSYLRGEPSSALLADGSPATALTGQRLS